jgi:hypothetical protein
MAAWNARLAAIGAGLAGALIGAIVTYFAVLWLIDRQTVKIVNNPAPPVVIQTTPPTSTPDVFRHVPPVTFPAPKNNKSDSDGPIDSKPADIITDYVIFRKINIADGMIETGWHYSNENQPKPDNQWCHMITSDTDSSGNGKIIIYRNMTTDQKSMCIWFDGKVPLDALNGTRL